MWSEVWGVNKCKHVDFDVYLDIIHGSVFVMNRLFLVIQLQHGRCFRWGWSPHGPLARWLKIRSARPALWTLWMVHKYRIYEYMCSEKSQWPTKSCFGQILKTLNSSRHRVKDFCIYHHTMADASMANVHRETHRTIDPWCLRGCKYPFSIPKEWQQVVQHSSTEAVKTTFYILNSLVVWNMNGLFFHHIGNVIIPTDFNSIIFQRGRAQPPTRYTPGISQS